MAKGKLKKVGNVIGNVIMYIFLALCVVAVIFTVFSKKDVDGASEIFGYQLRVVITDSMGKSELTDISKFRIKSIPKDSMILLETVPKDPAKAAEWYKDNVEVGDVLTFRYVYVTQETITHRVIEKNDLGNGAYEIVLEGDNKNSTSNQGKQYIYTAETESTNYVIGKVIGNSFLVGFLVTLLKNPIGMVFIVIVPCAIIIILEIIKIINVFNAERRKKDQAEKEKKDEEIEELRRRLAALEIKDSAEAVSVEASKAVDDGGGDKEEKRDERSNNNI